MRVPKTYLVSANKTERVFPHAHIQLVKQLLWNSGWHFLFIFCLILLRNKSVSRPPPCLWPLLMNKAVPKLTWKTQYADCNIVFWLWETVFRLLYTIKHIITLSHTMLMQCCCPLWIKPHVGENVLAAAERGRWNDAADIGQKETRIFSHNQLRLSWRTLTEQAALLTTKEIWYDKL